MVVSMNKQKVVSSKWIKTKVLAGSSKLAAHIPRTLRLTQATLSKLMNRYGMVYIKPVSGSLGVGVMRLDRRKGMWVVRAGRIRKTFTSYWKMFRWLRKRTKGKPYLVQRGIHVLRHKGRPVDFRIMVQKSKGVGWTVTGTVARVAHPRKVVTNGSQGGSIYGTRSLLIKTSAYKQVSRLSRLFSRLAKSTAARFQRTYPRMRELGLDIAVDRKHRAWILEVNTRPDPCPFTKLANPSMLRKIVRFGKGYGRSYDLRCFKARRGNG